MSWIYVFYTAVCYIRLPRFLNCPNRLIAKDLLITLWRRRVHGLNLQKKTVLKWLPKQILPVFDPKPDDFHGVKILLQTYLDNKQWDLSGFVDLILGHTTVGTVVKIEDDEDDGVFSLITALNLGRYKDHKCIMELKEFLLKVGPEKDAKDSLRLLLGEEAHNVGLSVSQRVVNLPPQILPPLCDALFDEFSWATED